MKGLARDGCSDKQIYDKSKLASDEEFEPMVKALRGKPNEYSPNWKSHTSKKQLTDTNP